MLQDATAALQAANADVSTLTPLLASLSASLPIAAASLVAVVAATGQQAAAAEEVAAGEGAAADTQGQLQEVQRLAQVWGLLGAAGPQPAH